jgi:hypothetical protein
MDKKECPHCPGGFGEWQEGIYFDRCNNCGYEVDKREQMPLQVPGANYGEYNMMPVVWQEEGFKFVFSAHDRGEQPHIHAQRKSGRRDNMKVWLSPIEVEYCKGFNSSEKAAILEIVERKRDFFLRKWKEFFKES